MEKKEKKVSSKMTVVTVTVTEKNRHMVMRANSKNTEKMAMATKVLKNTVKRAKLRRTDDNQIPTCKN